MNQYTQALTPLVQAFKLRLISEFHTRNVLADRSTGEFRNGVRVANIYSRPTDSCALATHLEVYVHNNSEEWVQFTFVIPQHYFGLVEAMRKILGTILGAALVAHRMLHETTYTRYRRLGKFSLMTRRRYHVPGPQGFREELSISQYLVFCPRLAQRVHAGERVRAVIRCLAAQTGNGAEIPLARGLVMIWGETLSGETLSIGLPASAAPKTCDKCQAPNLVNYRRSNNQEIICQKCFVSKECADCGDKNLTDVYTSQRDGREICGACFSLLNRRKRAKEKGFQLNGERWVDPKIEEKTKLRKRRIQNSVIYAQGLRDDPDLMVNTKTKAAKVMREAGCRYIKEALKRVSFKKSIIPFPSDSGLPSFSQETLDSLQEQWLHVVQP